MSKNFIWTFNESELASDLDRPLSLEYHVPMRKLKVAPEDIVGQQLWLVVRKANQFFLYALINPSIIELYQEGIYKNDFLLRCAQFLSIRFLPRHESLAPWRLPFQTDDGIVECLSDQHSYFEELIEKNQRKGFAPPTRLMIETIPPTSFLDLESSVPDQLMSTIRSVAYGDVFRSRQMPENLSAIGGITQLKLKETHPHLNEAEVIRLIAALDPLATWTENKKLKPAVEIERTLSTLPPVVDTFFEEIDPDKILPRIFVAKAVDSSLEWLDKTNDAERSHESILKDLVQHLKTNGFNVFKTRTFDLFAEKGSDRLLWEIKSADKHNSVSQGEKGIIQLLRYATALVGEKNSGIRFMLLLQDSGSTAVHEYLAKMASHTGSELWLYNDKRNWPDRIQDIAMNPYPVIKN